MNISKRRRARSSVVTLSIVTTLVAAGCGGGDSGGGSSSDQLTVGFAAAKTGSLAPFDQPIIQGLDFAVSEINDNGGIDGKYQVDLQTRDMRSESAVAATVAQELIDDGVDVLITPCDADTSIAAGQIAQRAGVLAISSCSTTPTVPTAVGDVMYLAATADNEQGAALAEYALDQGYHSAYLLKSPDTAYTEALPDYFGDAFEAGGGEVSGEGTFSVGAGDFSSQVTTIKNLGTPPDVIMTSAYVPDGPTFIRQLRAADVDIPVLGSDGLDSPTLFDAGGDAVEGLVFSTHGFPSDDNLLAKFYDKYTAATGKEPNTVFIGVGYDVMQVISAAVTRAGSTDPAAILDAMDGLTDVQGATSQISYPEGEQIPVREVSLVGVQGGELQLVDQLIPKNIPAP